MTAIRRMAHSFGTCTIPKRHCKNILSMREPQARYLAAPMFVNSQNFYLQFCWRARSVTVTCDTSPFRRIDLRRGHLMKIARTGIGILAIVLAATVVSALRAHEPRPLPKDLAWIPAKSAAVAHVRFADVWNSSIGKNFVNLVNAIDPQAIARAEKEMGFSFSRIDRVTLLLPAFDERRDPVDGSAIRITMTKPYDR